MSQEMVPIAEYLEDCRAAIKDRAQYVALIVRELDARGLDADDIISAAFEVPSEPGDEKKGADEWAISVATRLGYQAFETTREQMTSERAVIINHYCPLIEVWTEMGLGQDQMVRLCGLFEKRDVKRRTMAGIDKGVRQIIARGDAICETIYTKKR